MASEKETKQEKIKEKVIKIEAAERVFPKKKDKKASNAYLFGKAFGERLRSDKLFFVSFLITLFFVAVFSYRLLKNSESSYPGFVNRFISNNEVSPTSDDNDNKAPVVVDEELDVSDKVGIYSREVVLNEGIQLSDSCKIDSYKYIYQIKKDNSIGKYLYNDCLGTIAVWNDKLDYVTIGDTKYIGTNDIHFLFSGTSMREADGDTYKIDDSITSIKEKNNIKNLEVNFVDNNVVFVGLKNLIVMKGNSVLFNLNKEYSNNGGKLNKMVYQIDKTNYKFIVFDNGEEMNCSDEYTDDGLLYKIYSISYDKEKMIFNSAKEVLSRNKNEGCAHWEEDLELLRK